MHHSRKSTLGTHGVLPVRVDTIMRKERSPLGSGFTVGPIRFGSTHPTTPRLGSCRKVSPVRLGDVLNKDLSRLFSSKKYTDVLSTKSPKYARRLFRGGLNNKATSAQKVVAPSRPVERTLQKPAIITTSLKSQLPKPASVKNQKSIANTKRIAVPKTTAVVPCTSSVPPSSNTRKMSVKKPTSGETKSQATNAALTEILHEQREVLQEIKSLAEEQRNMLEEAKRTFSQVLQDQSNILQEMKQSQQELKKLLNRAQEQDHDLTSMERHIEKETKDDQGGKKKSVHLSPRKSVAAYKEMRKSFRCLGTPTFSTKKLRTPKTRTPRQSLSDRVRAQLQDLLDD